MRPRGSQALATPLGQTARLEQFVVPADEVSSADLWRTVAAGLDVPTHRAAVVGLLGVHLAAAGRARQFEGHALMMIPESGDTVTSMRTRQALDLVSASGDGVPTGRDTA